MDSRGDEGQAVTWCQSQDQNEVPSVLDQVALSFFCELEGCKEEFEKGC